MRKAVGIDLRAPGPGLTSGLVTDVEHSVLPSIAPAATMLLTLAAMAVRVSLCNTILSLLTAACALECGTETPPAPVLVGCDVLSNVLIHARSGLSTAVLLTCVADVVLPVHRLACARESDIDGHSAPRV